MLEAMKKKISQAYTWVRKQVVAVYNKVIGFFKSVFDRFKNLSLFKSKDACCADKTQGAGNAGPAAVVTVANGEALPAGAAPTEPQATGSAQPPPALTESALAAHDANPGEQAAPKKASSRTSSKASNQ